MNRSKRIIHWHHLKVAFALVPGPDARAVHAETMRQPLFQGTGGQTVLGTMGKPPPLGGGTGGSAVFDPEAQTRRELAEVRSPDRPASSCGNRAEPMGKGMTRSMLSARTALASGPQPKHPGNVKLCESPGGAGGLPKGN